ncbi:MAG TPA: outer membrane beta-barrel protein [Vicinamibacterales bacterium]|nr:outer membrane beta-barrel protein [Vicinamibacterales bacterium]
MKALILAGVVATALAPAQARAEGYISPFAGVHFGNDQLEKKFVFGADAGWMGAGIIGGEVDFGWAPDAFGESVDNHLLDVMGNLIIGVPIGGTSGRGVRPYVTGGLGMIQSKISSGLSGVPDYDKKDFAFDVGAGAMGFFSDHVGLRGDVRYFRTINNNDSSLDNGLNLDLGNFDFWRASVGVVIR